MPRTKAQRPILHLEDVWKVYKVGEVEVPALKGVTLEVMEGDYVSIIGASGSGKSTLMNLIGCLDLPSRGTVYLKSNDISKLGESDLASFRGRTIGFVFQQYNLIPSMSALENVMLPMEFLEYGDSEAHEKARNLLEMMGLGGKLRQKPTQLSGGEQQRVSIARSLATDPEIILADEPTGALDSATGKDVLKILHQLWEDDGKTLIMVTHDPNVAKYSHKTVELRDGRVVKNFVK